MEDEAAPEAPPEEIPTLAEAKAAFDKVAQSRDVNRLRKAWGAR